MCVQWISGSIRESRLVRLQQIRQAKQIQAVGWSSGALTHIALMCTSLPITLTIGCHISWACRDLHTLPAGKTSLPITSCCHIPTLAIRPAWLQEVLDESEWSHAITSLGTKCVGSSFGTQIQCWPWCSQINIQASACQVKSLKARESASSVL